MTLLQRSSKMYLANSRGEEIEIEDDSKPKLGSKWKSTKQNKAEQFSWVIERNHNKLSQKTGPLYIKLNF